MDSKYGRTTPRVSLKSTQIRDSVCKIHFHGKEYDFEQPYNDHLDAGSSTGTGFVLDAFPPQTEPNGDHTVFIVTAYHVVEHATRITCEFNVLNGNPVEGELVAYGLHLDVALVKVVIAHRPSADEAEVTWSPLATGASDAVQPTDTVLAAGFALGHDYQVTSGSISGRSATRIQVDAAINGGNSGGPLLNEANEVLGVVVSGYDPGVAQNINFVSPIVETVAYLRSVLEASALTAPERAFNATIVPSFSALHFDRESTQICPYGGYVTQVHPGSALHEAGMRRKDVLCNVDGYDLDMRGKIQTAWWSVDRLDIETLLERRFEGESVDATFWSHLERRVVSTSIKVERKLDVFREIDPLATPPRYTVRGGLVVQSLTHNHKRLAHAYRHIFRQPQVREQSLLVVTFVRPESPFTSMDTISEGDIVLYVNETVVRTIDDYVDAWRRWEAGDAAYISLTLYDGNLAVATRESLAKAHEITLEDTGLKELDQLVGDERT